MEKAKASWQLSTAKDFEETAETLSRLWTDMVKHEYDKIYCIGPNNTGRLVLSIKELSDTINFLRTIKDMEELSGGKENE